MTGDLTKQTSNRLIRAGLIFFLFLLIIIPSSGFANWGGGDDSEPKQTNFEKGITEIEAKNYKKAVKYLKKAAKKDKNNADIYNLLGYSYRKMGKYDDSLKYYTKALELEPTHLDANEYIGELYLETDRPAKADEHLQILADTCNSSCEQYEQLKNAIELYSSNNPVPQKEM